MSSQGEGAPSPAEASVTVARGAAAALTPVDAAPRAEHLDTVVRGWALRSLGDRVARIRGERRGRGDREKCLGAAAEAACRRAHRAAIGAVRSAEPAKAAALGACGRAGSRRSAGSRRRRPTRGRSRRPGAPDEHAALEVTDRVGARPEALHRALEAALTRVGGDAAAIGRSPAARPRGRAARRRRGARGGRRAGGGRPGRRRAGRRGGAAEVLRASRGCPARRRGHEGRGTGTAGTCGTDGTSSCDGGSSGGVSGRDGSWIGGTDGSLGSTCPATSPAAATENAHAHARGRVSILLTRGDDICE